MGNMNFWGKWNIPNFLFFDKGNLIVLLSGFQKKTQKTSKSEIKRAERLKKEYYENK